MFGWLARIFLIAGGVIAGWFVSPDANNFEIVRMVAAIFLFMLFAVAAAFWPKLVRWFKADNSQHKDTGN